MPYTCQLSGRLCRVKREDGARRERARRGEGGRLREEIIASARRMLSESGDANLLSLRAVARDVGIATTSIYLHFKDLTELVHAVKYELFDELSKELEESVAGIDAPRERLLARGDAYLRFGLSRPGDYRAMFSAMDLGNATDPDLGEFPGAEVFRLLRSDVAALVGEQDALTVATHLWTAIHGMVTLRPLTLFPWPPAEDLMRDLVDRLARK